MDNNTEAQTDSTQLDDSNAEVVNGQNGSRSAG